MRYTITAVLLLCIGCSEDTGESLSSAASAQTASSSSLIFIDRKTENDGLHDSMELYAVDGSFDPKEFRALCVEKKKNAKAKAFNYVVVFDQSINAKFPNSPFTAGFGIEEDKIRHIIAIFEYNKLNGFCEMRVYEPNMWEGKAVTEKL